MSDETCRECPCFEFVGKNEHTVFDSICHLENAKTVIYDPDTWWCWDGRKIMKENQAEKDREIRDSRLKSEAAARQEQETAEARKAIAALESAGGAAEFPTILAAFKQMASRPLDYGNAMCEAMPMSARQLRRR